MLDARSETIDFVIPWVDGSDKKWLAQKSLFINSDSSSDGFDEEKYRDWDLLRYWFRGVEQFAPWVRKIHFVTWGHIPSWLNVSHPKINVVRHEDYIPREFLPTFSSHVIELNFHRIDGLAEKFVYFNDDTFLIRPVHKEDFFKKGLPCASAILVPFRTLKGDWLTAPLNNVAVINDHFGFHKSVLNHFSKWFNIKYGFANVLSAWMLPYRAFYGFLEFHLPNSFLKSTFEEVWKLEEELLVETSSHKFRDRSDVNQWLFENWQFAQGMFAPRSLRFGEAFYLSDCSDSKVRAVVDYIENQKGSVICVNDGKMDKRFLGVAKESVEGAFQKILPNKSLFEKAE